MKLLIEQLRAERLHLHRLCHAIGTAVEARRWTQVAKDGGNLIHLLRSHFAFSRDVLPTLAQLNGLKGAVGRADRVARFVRELPSLEAAIVPPLQRLVEDPSSAQERWDTSRQVLLAFLAESAEVAELHAGAAGVDRREAPRVFCSGPVEVLAPAKTEGLLRDLSLFGLQVELREGEPRVGALVSLRVRIPGLDDAVDASAEVRWRGAKDPTGVTGYGLRFVELPPVAGLAIARHVAAQSERQ